MSRTPVRAALKRLEDEKLVYSLPNLGTFVEQITLRDVLEMNELRTVLEIKAMESCIEKASNEDIDKCRAVVESMSLEDSADELHSKDSYFNDFIISYCTNGRLLESLKGLNAQLTRPRYSVAFNQKRLKGLKEDHLKILKYIEERSFSKAAKMLQKHHKRYNSFMEEYLKVIV